jgi:hypothetical protein
MALPPIQTVVHSASADLHVGFGTSDNHTAGASTIFDDNFTSTSCLRYSLNLPEKLERQVAKDPVRATKFAAQERARGNTVRVRPGMKKMNRHESLREYFEFFDKDQSGAIDFKEMSSTLPKIGMNNLMERAKVEAHFKFMDKDNSGEIKFDEFIKSTIDAGMPANLADEQYAARFDKEMFTFLGLALRAQLKADYEKERKQKRDDFKADPLTEFLQFQRLVRISQAAVMPNEMSKASKKRVEAPADWVHSEMADHFKASFSPTMMMMGSPESAHDVRKQHKAAKAAKGNKLRSKRAAICRRARKKRSFALPGGASEWKERQPPQPPPVAGAARAGANTERREKKLEKIYAEERRGARLPVIERWPGKNIVPGGHRPGL